MSYDVGCGSREGGRNVFGPCACGVEVVHGGLDAGVAEEFLDGQYGVCQQQVGVSGALSSFLHERGQHPDRVRMSHRVRCDVNVAGRLVSVAGVADSFASVGEELVPAFESGWESAAGYEQREWVDGAVIEEPDGFGP